MASQKGKIWFKTKHAPPGFVLMYGCSKETEIRLDGPFIFSSEKINKGLAVPSKDLPRLARVLKKWKIRYELPYDLSKQKAAMMGELEGAIKTI